jgi:hypothetical protein
VSDIIVSSIHHPLFNMTMMATMNFMLTNRAPPLLLRQSPSSILLRHLTSTHHHYPPSNTPETKPRVIILGSGWAGYTLASRLSKSHYDVRVISPANHFLFTPLLPSTAVGTLEFRAIQEPVRTIRGLGQYYMAKGREIDLERKVVMCEDLYKGVKFEVGFDYLILAAGMKVSLFCLCCSDVAF